MSVTSSWAFYDLRDWWSSHDRVAELLNINPGGLSPWFPAAQQPESPFPYVRYNITRAIDFPEWWMHTEVVTLEPFMTNIDHLVEFTNVLIDLSSQGAVSARDLERWTRTQPGRERDFAFHSIEFMGAEDIDPPSEEAAASSLAMHFAILYSPLRGKYIS